MTDRTTRLVSISKNLTNNREEAPKTSNNNQKTNFLQIICETGKEQVSSNSCLLNFSLSQTSALFLVGKRGREERRKEAKGDMIMNHNIIIGMGIYLFQQSDGFYQGKDTDTKENKKHFTHGSNPRLFRNLYKMQTKVLR